MYDDYCLNAAMDNKGNMKPPSRQRVATWVVEAWSKIKPSLIIKAFLSTGLTTPAMYDLDTEENRTDYGLAREIIERAYQNDCTLVLLENEVDDLDRDTLAMAIDYADLSDVSSRSSGSSEEGDSSRERDHDNHDDSVGAVLTTVTATLGPEEAKGMACDDSDAETVITAAKRAELSDRYFQAEDLAGKWYFTFASITLLYTF